MKNDHPLQKDVANIGRDLRAIVKSVVKNWFVFIPVLFLSGWLGLRSAAFTVPEVTLGAAVNCTSDETGCIGDPALKSASQNAWLVRDSINAVVMETPSKQVLEDVFNGIDLEYDRCVFSISITAPSDNQEFAGRALDHLVSRVLEIEAAWVDRKIKLLQEEAVGLIQRRVALAGDLLEDGAAERGVDLENSGGLTIEIPSRRSQIFGEILDLESKIATLEHSRSSIKPAEILADVREVKDPVPRLSLARVILILLTSLAIAAFLSVSFEVVRFVLRPE